MSSSLKPYPEYKPSDLPWLAELPSHWASKRAKRLFTRMQRPVRPEDDVVTCFRDGIVTLRKNRRTTGFTESLKEIGYQGVRRNDLVIHAMDAFAGAIGVSDADGKCTPVYSICKPNSNANPYYFAHVVREMSRSKYIEALARGIRERSSDFRFEMFANQFLPLPPIEEQGAITRFLLAFEISVNRLIRTKQRLIKLLNEQKQAIIHCAVTRGFDPNVSLRPSGVDWLGNVPEHWRIKRLKWLTRLQRGYDLPHDRRRVGMVPVISSGGVIDTHCEARAKGPGVVMGRYGSTDAVYFVDKDYWPHNTSLFVTDFQGNDPRWCFYLLRTISKADHATKSAVPGVDRKDLYEIYVPQPSTDEQISLVKSLEKQLVKFEASIEDAQRQIALIREYRIRLIADVVTGKLDIRGVVPVLDDVEELEPLDAADEIEAEALDETEELTYADD